MKQNYRINKRSFYKTGQEHYGLSIKACAKAWKMVKYKKGTDIYGEGERRQYFADFVNFMSSGYQF